MKINGKKTNKKIIAVIAIIIVGSIFASIVIADFLTDAIWDALHPDLPKPAWWGGPYHRYNPRWLLSALVFSVFLVTFLYIYSFMHNRMQKMEYCKTKQQYQKRVEALKEEGIPITHKNIFDKSIRPDVPIREQKD